MNHHHVTARETAVGVFNMAGGVFCFCSWALGGDGVVLSALSSRRWGFACSWVLYCASFIFHFLLLSPLLLSFAHMRHVHDGYFLFCLFVGFEYIIILHMIACSFSTLIDVFFSPVCCIIIECISIIYLKCNGKSLWKHL